MPHPLALSHYRYPLVALSISLAAVCLRRLRAVLYGKRTMSGIGELWRLRALTDFAVEVAWSAYVDVSRVSALFLLEHGESGNQAESALEFATGGNWGGRGGRFFWRGVLEAAGAHIPTELGVRHHTPQFSAAFRHEIPAMCGPCDTNKM
jgi:hypothetical protein